MQCKKVRPGVLTTYLIGKNKYASYVLGHKMNDIKQAIELRNLHETIESELQPVDLLPDFSSMNKQQFEENIPQILHTCCYLSFVAMKAHTVSIDDILGDEGIIHEMSHYLVNKKTKKNNSLNKLRKLFISLKKKSIGFYDPV
jgi:hypothetical protein